MSGKSTSVSVLLKSLTYLVMWCLLQYVNKITVFHSIVTFCIFLDRIVPKCQMQNRIYSPCSLVWPQCQWRLLGSLWHRPMIAVSLVVPDGARRSALQRGPLHSAGMDLPVHPRLTMGMPRLWGKGGWSGNTSVRSYLKSLFQSKQKFIQKQFYIKKQTMYAFWITEFNEYPLFK